MRGMPMSLLIMIDEDVVAIVYIFCQALNLP